MKDKIFKIGYWSIVVFLLVSFGQDPYLIKRISDKNFRYEFYTSAKVVKSKKDKEYFWFKGGMIHAAQSGIAGELLHDKFVKFYHSNQLAEQGQFKFGLKNGQWKSWYENGNLSSVSQWKAGFKNGEFVVFGNDGAIVEKGNYKNNLKTGKWINYEKKDTLLYSKGQILTPKVKPQKIKAVKEKKTVKPKETIKPKEPVKKAEQKESFFKRLFRKKNDQKKTNDKGA